METSIINITSLKYDLKNAFESLKYNDLIVLKHSDPVGVIVSKDRYDELMRLEREKG